MQSPRRPRRPQDAPSATHERRPLTDFSGILLIGIGTLMFLALISFSPEDLPSWISWSRRPSPADQGTNLLGPVGTVFSGYLIFLLGAAGFFLPIGLIWFGMAKILMRLRLLWIPTMGLLMILGSVSSLLAIQTFAFQDWGHRFQILCPGGGIGWLGREMADRTVGTFAMGLACVFGSLMGVVMLFGMRPKQALFHAQEWIDSMRERRLLARQAEAEQALAEERAALDAERALARQTRGGGRRTRGADSDSGLVIPGSEVVAALSEQELGLDLNPVVAKGPEEPEIIDGTARKSEGEDSAARKMSLAEWRAKRQPAKTPSEPGTASASGMASALRGLSEAFKDYQLPDLDLLHWDEITERKPADKGLLLATQQTIIRTLANFGVNVTPATITRGPSITRYEIYPTDGLRVQKIVALEPDLARATKAEFINILAPIPGKDTVGIEIANSDKVPVPLRELLEDPKFHKGKARLPLALGKDVYGETIIADLAAMPHLLIAGATGAGKSVCINSVIASLLFQFGPDQLRFIMVDPKVVEMQIFNDLPHLIVPVVTEPKKVLAALKWCVNEMEHRYRIFAKEGVRNFEGFNSRKRKAPAAPSAPPKRSSQRAQAGVEAELPLFDPLPETEDKTPTAATTADSAAPPWVVHPVRMGGNRNTEDDDPFAFVDDSELENRAKFAAELGQDVADYYEDENEVDEIPAEDVVPDTVPYIVVIIDELADLMQTASADVENLIARLTQKARAAGIHLIVATQTPRASVITGVIKANIPCRIAFQVSSGLDSRVILDGNGAEKLVGKGDMLYLPPGTSKLTRVQGAFITDEEMTALVDHCKAQGRPMYDSAVQASIKAASDEEEEAQDDELTPDDVELMERCIEVILQEKIASTSRLQRRLKLGYTRAARMMDILEKRGMVGPGEGAKPREILISPDDYPEV